MVSQASVIIEVVQGTRLIGAHAMYIPWLVQDQYLGLSCIVPCLQNNKTNLA
jgi:hypothetical protein